MPIKQGETLLQIARASISEALGRAMQTDETAPWLLNPGASFVTLMHFARLRGCIGSLEPYLPLLEDVKKNALAAAFRDPRFSPLTAPELDDTEIEVSVLSSMQPVLFDSEENLLEQLRPGVDGVVIQYGSYRGTFLPQVWEQLPRPKDFWAQLKYKAGLPEGFWNNDMQVLRYTVSKWKESDLGTTS